MFCPTCFHLGLNLYILALPPSSPCFPYGADIPEKLNIPWEVKIPTLIDALHAGCQFCTYIACRLLSFTYVNITGQFLRTNGPRCCARGSLTEDLKGIQDVLSTVENIQWKVGREARVMQFNCRAVNQNSVSGSLSKVSISLPGLTSGNVNPDATFSPMMVEVQGTSQSGELTKITGFHYPPTSSQKTRECVLELHTLPGQPP
jgi:hypothetical protein